jgi:bla regulator protein blaR1
MITELANHLWQSTLFALAVCLLTLMCRRNHASVRYWLWFTASIKFVTPFALLTSLVDRLEWASKAPQIAAPAVSATLAQVSRPFVMEPVIAGLSVPEAPRGFGWFAVVVLAVWVAGIITMSVVRFRMWLHIRAAVRASSPWSIPDLPFPAGINVRSTPGLMEPGVVGLWHPVLLVPSGIEDDLTPRQLAAVLTHELCHIRRRDNVTAAVHMITEAMFWFHPLVWWIGSRLVDERERACDEEVVRRFGEPQTYAEGIVSVCRRYVESPLVCVSGVSGSNVKNRIRDIMTNRAVAKLSAGKKVVLAAVATVAVAVPIVAQSVPRPSASALRFEVASVKPHKPNAGDPVRVMTRLQPGGGFEAVNVTLGSVIRLAYELQDFQVVGAPEWVNSDRFDILARGPAGAVESEVPRRLQPLLVERFALRAHIETRDHPIYALVLARADRSAGPRLRRSQVDREKVREAMAAARRENRLPPRVECGLTADRTFGFCGMTIEELAGFLPMYAGRMVVDRTGLTGAFDLEFRFDASRPIPGAGTGGGFPIQATGPADPDAPSIFTALEEQLGLKLEAQTGPVEVLVIDHVERPTPN